MVWTTYIWTTNTLTLLKSKNIFKLIPRGWYLLCKLSQRKVPSGKPYKITWLPFGRWESRYCRVCMTFEYNFSGVVMSGTGSIFLFTKETENILVYYRINACKYKTHPQNTHTHTHKIVIGVICKIFLVSGLLCGWVGHWLVWPMSCEQKWHVSCLVVWEPPGCPFSLPWVWAMF